MTFLQPSLLYALPAAGLPVLIHLLNRLRFRSVRWAAMMFLLSATRSSTRRARLRHYLILLLRTLAILFLVLAAGRPLVGGWLGASLTGAPDTILLLLDRSASMETSDPRTRQSRRQHALARLAQAAAERGPGSRLVLIESVLVTPQALAGPDVLQDLPMTGPTDTAADVLAMLRAALDYVTGNQTGQTEIWIASDLQQNNWRPESRDWASLAAQFGALPQPVRLRVLALQSEGVHNASLSLHDVLLRQAADATNLNLVLDLTTTHPGEAAVPLILTLSGVRSRQDVRMESTELRYSWKLAAPPAPAAPAWGVLELAADDNLRDNSAFFAFDTDVPLRAAVISTSAAEGRYLMLALAPGPSLPGRSCAILSPHETDGLDRESLSLLVWQAPPPAPAVAERLSAFLDQGGVVVCFPPGDTAPSDPTNALAVGTDTLFPVFLPGAVSAPPDRPFRIGVWDESEGPLARTADGRDLPLARVTVHTRWLVAGADAPAPGAGPGRDDRGPADSRTAGDWTVIARYADGPPFLLKRPVGRGWLFVCTALPAAGRSNLADGPVLVPMLQRLMNLGARRLRRADRELCGRWRPDDPAAAWVCLDAPGSKDIRWDAGVYGLAQRRLALNRPPQEDVPDALDPDRARSLFGSLDAKVVQEFSGDTRGSLQTEIWPLLLILAFLCLLTESALLVTERQGSGGGAP